MHTRSMNCKSLMFALSLLVVSSSVLADDSVRIAGPLPLPVTGAIGLAPGSAVTVANPATNPVPVNIDSGREPFEVRGVLGSATSVAVADLVQVPAGKLLVIEHVSAGLNVGSSATQATSNLHIVNAFLNDFVGCVPAGSNALNHLLVCSSQTKVYVPAGDKVQFAANALDSDGINGEVFVSGYFVRAP